MADQVDGQKVPKSKFGYAPAGSKPSEWKFPLDTKARAASAIDMFHHEKGIPPGAMAALKAKIVSAAREFGVDAEKIKRFESRQAEKSSEARIGVLLTNEGAAVETPADITLHRPGTQLREIAVAVPGSWVKGDHSFSITKEDLADMVRNFEKRKNDMLVIDYEHASEQPEIAKGGPIPGAGWIHRLSLSGQDGRAPSAPSDALTALVEWTPQAEQMLRTGQYRFFSPAIDWSAKDKESGDPQGATLTSGALTNHPFLEELPPIMLSDGTLVTSSVDSRFRGNDREAKGATMADKEKKERLEDPEEQLADKETEGEGEGKQDLPKLTVRKGRKGSRHEGHHILSDGDTDVGYMSEDDLAAHAKKHLGVNPDDNEDKAMASEGARRSLILTEVAPGGKIDSRKAIELSNRGAITFGDYVAAQEAEKMIDAAVREGKILPRDRKFFFSDALQRPDELAEYLAGKQAVNLSTVGFGDADRPNADAEVDAGVKKLMTQNKLDYASAFKQFLSENPVLAEQYRSKHSSRVNADGTSN